MASAAAPLSDSDRTEQIISQFLHKTLHAVLTSRIPQLGGGGGSGSAGGSSAARHLPPQARKRDRWFHLALGNLPLPLDLIHHSDGGDGAVEPLVVDIILVALGARHLELVVERWTIQCEPPAPPWLAAAHDGASPSSASSPAASSSSYRRTYKKCIILLRSLYAMLRLLPAYRVFRMLCFSNQSYNYDLTYRVSPFAAPFSREEEAALRHYEFSPVETLVGQLAVSVQYRPTLADFNFEVSSPTPPTIIANYVGSPAAEPMRSFPSSLPNRGASPISYLVRGSRRKASSPLDRPHSWNSAPLAHHPLSMSPAQTSEMRFSPPENFGLWMPSQRPSSSSADRKGNFSFDELKLSPPLSTSPTPSPPAHVSNRQLNRLRSETAPVSIPTPVAGRNVTQCSPNFSDPPRSLLPPLSPRSVRADHSSQESPTEGRSFRKLEGLRIGDVYSNLHAGAAQKVLKDGRDDSGRFSAVSSAGSPRYGFSRSSSRLSVQDDLDEGDYSYPFAVDDVDTSDSQTRSLDGKEAPEYSSPAKSQDAAVGILVHMLKTAPPLRQDQSFSSQSSRSELNEVGSSSSVFMPRKTSDALEELQSYKEMKNFLLSRSGTNLLDSVRQRKG